MPIDPSIALSIKPVQIQDPLNRMAAMMQLESGQQSQQLNALQMKKAQQEFDTQNRLGKAWQGSINRDTGEIDYNSLLKNLSTDEIGATAIPGVIKSRKEAALAEQQLKTQQTAEQKNLADIKAAALKNIREKTSDLQFNPYDDNVKAHAQDAVLHGVWTPEQATQNVAQALAIPIADRPAYFARQGLDAEKRVTTQETARHNLQTETNAAEQLKISKGTLSVAQQRLKAELDSTGTLTPAAIDVAAQIYIQTGQLPALGIGQKAGMLKASVLNRATELYNNPAGAAPNVNLAGVAPNVNAPAGANAPAPFNASNMAEQIVGNKMDVATRTKANKDFSTGIQGRQVTAFNTAIDHLSTMDKLSDALQNNDIKAFNYLGNVVAKQTGQPAPVNFDAAKQIVTAEIIKAVVASGGGVRERQEAEANFATANSPAQLKGVINTYKQLLGGQLNSLGLQYQNTTGRTDFDKKLTGEAKQAFTSVREQHNASANQTTVTTSDGKVYNFPTPEAADKFKKAAGIK